MADKWMNSSENSTYFWGKITSNSTIFRTFAPSIDLWLVSFTVAILEWFRENGRVLPWRETRDPYAIWLSEIILQQTRIEQGKPYWERFMKRWPTVEALAQASEDEVLREWSWRNCSTRLSKTIQTTKRMKPSMFISSTRNPSSQWWSRARDLCEIQFTNIQMISWFISMAVTCDWPFSRGCASISTTSTWMESIASIWISIAHRYYSRTTMLFRVESEIPPMVRIRRLTPEWQMWNSVKEGTLGRIR